MKMELLKNICAKLGLNSFLARVARTDNNRIAAHAFSSSYFVFLKKARRQYPISYMPFKLHLMSRSVHITKRNFKGLTNKELDKQAKDSTSELRQWAKKSLLKEEVKKTRKQEKIKNKKDK
jgi:hypothetical protein